jgi:hypothetical protein
MPTSPLGPWTKREDDLIRTLPAAEAIRQTGRTCQGVYHRRRKLGLTGEKRWHEWTMAEDRIVVRFKPREAANQLAHLTITVIYRRRLVLLNGKPGRKKRKKTYRRLSPALEKLIRARAGKVNAADLALKLGLSRQTIYTVARGSMKATREYPFGGRKSRNSRPRRVA